MTSDLTQQALKYILKPDWMDLVREFHAKFKVRKDPKLGTGRVRDLRIDLIEEEWLELREAAYVWDKKQMADALGDLIYVICGAADVWGIDLDRVVREIHRSNMTKTPGLERDDGKILKGPNYSPPNLEFVNV